MFLITRDRLIWLGIAALGLVGIILGIVGLSTKVGMNHYQIFDFLDELNKGPEPIVAIVEHARFVAAGGFISIILGIAVIVICGVCIYRYIQPEYTKITLLLAALIILSIVAGGVSIGMAADLNDLSWFDKVAESHGAPPGWFSDDFKRRQELY